MITLGDTRIDLPWSDHPVLDSISIEWGTDSPDTQPEPAVCSFTIKDTRGTLVRDFYTLSGLELGVDIPDIGIMFAGVVTSGGTIRRRGAAWLIDLTASSYMILWKRLMDNGDPGRDGTHWIGPPEYRILLMNRRANAAHAPLADTSGLELPASVAPYDANSHPSQLTLLHRLYAHLPDMPLWSEHTNMWSIWIGHTDIGRPYEPSSIDGIPAVIVDGETRPAISTADIICDDDLTLDITEPWTKITVTGKTAGTDDQGNTTYNDTDLSYNATGLPAAYMETQKSLAMESDAILQSSLPDHPATVITDSQRAQAATWLRTMATRLTPSTITFDSDHLDPSTHQWAFKPQPSCPFAITDDDTDHTPITTWIADVMQTIGGTITITNHQGTMHIINETTVIPVPEPR